MSNNRIEPWNHPLSIWKDAKGNPSKSKYFVWLRGNLRQIWSDYPLRKEWKASKLRPVSKAEKLAKTFHPSTKNVGQCYLCNEWMAGSKLECDHIEESDGCYDFDTAEGFLWHCAANDPDNWALACSPCHKIKSHSVKKGISFEEARIDKMAIAWINDKSMPHAKFLQDRGYTAEQVSNKPKRRACYIEWVKKQEGVADEN